MVKATGTGRTGLSLRNRYGRRLIELLTKKSLQSLADCLSGCVLLEGRYVYDDYVCANLVKSEVVSEESCRTLTDHERLWNKMNICKNGEYVYREQEVYATHGFGAERK